MISFTEMQTQYGDLTQNATSANLARGAKLANIEHRYLLQKYFNNEGSFSILTVANQQFYSLPPNYSKLKTLTITVGTLKWTPTEVLTREEWDKLNVFPYYSDIPNNYFIYPGGDHGGQVGIWPIPSSSGNTITFNYKYRVADLSMADVTSTATITTLTTAVSAATAFVPTVNAQQESRWLKFAQPDGDNLWYQVATVPTSTTATLYQPYQGSTITAKTCTMGQMPLLHEDFQDMLIWKPLIFYFSTIVPDPAKVAEFKELYNQKLKQLDEYAGSKTINVNLGRRPMSRNPNLYGQSFG